MSGRNWSVTLASLAACGTTAAALAFGSASLNPNSMLRGVKPSSSMAGTRLAADGTRPYIVRFLDAPVASYAGGVKSFSATNPRTLGRRTLDVTRNESKAYLEYLAGQHLDFLDRAGKAIGRVLEPRYTYSYAFNGMALRMTPAEAATLETLPGVRYVQPDRTYKPVASVPVPGTAAYTEPSRAWIGADIVWSKPTFATGVTGATSNDNEGEGIVVADLDTGVNALNSSFGATGMDNYTIPDPLGTNTYLGVCNAANTTASQPNTFDATFHCNSKLIGAYTYTRYATNPSNDPNSPEDSEGHGSHTASTAAGDFTTGASASDITSPLSGVAPHANLIVYDVCDPTDSCPESDSIAAIEQAIKDQSAIESAAGSAFKGMVMNFSIGGSSDPYLDPVDQAFFNAEQAGIYVSAAGGNSGPVVNNSERYGPVQHLAPWLATTAAATDDGVFTGNNVTVFGSGAPSPSGSTCGAAFCGSGTTGGISAATEIVYAGNHPYTTAYYSSLSTSSKYPLSGQAYADPTLQAAQQAAAQCLYPFTAGSTIPAIPAGAIVVCDRGTIALVDKADNVKQGSAGGIVIVSQSGNALLAEPYEIPGTMLDNTDGSSIETWLGTSDNATFTATLSGSSLGTCGVSCSGIADQVAAFSSRGPNNNVYDNIVKPDLVAPGVQILAAVADPCYLAGAAPSCTHQPETFDFYDGTSMATPHDTGAAALLKQLHNGWTPMEVKSALMTTAVTAMGDQCSVAGICNSTLSTSPSPQVTGAGRINLKDAARAGFVMDEAFSGQSTLINSNTDAAAAALQGFNLPSLGNNACIITCTWTRTLTATQTGASLTFTVTSNQSWLTVASNSGAAGSSANFTLAPGGTATLVFTATMPSNTWNQWVFAEVDFASSSTEDDGSPPPAQHFPVASYNQQPEPQMGASPASIDVSFATGSPAQNQTITVSNSGQAALSWNVGSGNTSAGSIVKQLPDGKSGTTFGYPSDLFSKDGHGIYESDRFSMSVTGSVTTIATPGFTLKGTAAGNLADAASITWYVYADSGGAPGGNPEDGKKDYLWTFSSTPTATGVDTSDGNDITLNLTTANAPALNLRVGTYWLVVAPTFNSSCRFSGANISVGGCSGESWYWDESSPGSGVGSFIDPVDLTQVATGTGWNKIGPNTTTTKSATGSVTLAFTLTGTLNCSGSSPVSGASLSPTSGSAAAGASSLITVTFNPAGLQAGTYSGAACIEGNDPSTPFTVVPLMETVSAASGGGGGGGSGGGKGSLDLMGILALAAFAAWRRQRT